MVRKTPEINRIDRRLWQRFVKVAIPYWYPTQRKAGRFLFMLVMLLVFLFAALFLALAFTIWLGQQLVPEFTQLVASGLLELTQEGISSPRYKLVLAMALIVPILTFGWQFQRLRTRRRQWFLLALLLLFSIMVSGLNVILSYVVRFIETALVEQEVSRFWLFLGVFGAVFVVGTPIVVIYRYCQELLGVHWREWLTDNFFTTILTKSSLLSN